MPITFNNRTEILKFSQALSKKQLKERNQQPYHTGRSNFRREDDRYRGNKANINYSNNNDNYLNLQFQGEKRSGISRNEAKTRGKRIKRKSLEDLDGWIRYNIRLNNNKSLNSLFITFGGGVLKDIRSFLEFYEAEEYKGFLNIEYIEEKLGFSQEIDIPPKSMQLKKRPSLIDELSPVKRTNLFSRNEEIFKRSTDISLGDIKETYDNYYHRGHGPNHQFKKNL